MKFKIFFFTSLLNYIILQAQPLQRINGSSISTDSLTMLIQRLMQAANVSGAAISVFNNDKPVYSKTFGLADVQKGIPLTANTEMYGASLSKMVFAYIVMQLVQDKIIDLDKPLVEYL